MKGLIFTYVTTYGGSVVAIFAPYVGLLIYVGYGIANPATLWPWSVPAGNYSRTIAICMTIGWVLNGFGKWSIHRGLLPAACLTGFWICCVLSGLQANDWPIAHKFLDNLTKIVFPILVGATLIHSVQQLRQMAWVITLTVGFLAFNENQRYLVYGAFIGDNMLAHTMAAGCGLAFFLGTHQNRLSLKMLAFFASGLMVHTVMIHMSRGAMLGLCAVAIVTFVVIKKNLAQIGLFAMGLSVALYFAGPAVMQEFRSIRTADDESSESRFELWKAMWKETKARPILGLGPRHWPLAAENHGFKKGKEGHGLWQQLACEIGLPGVTMLFLYYALIVWQLFPIARSTDPAFAELRPYAQMVCCSIPGFMLEACVGSFYLMELPYYLGLLGLGTLNVAANVRHSTLRPSALHPAHYGH